MQTVISAFKDSDTAQRALNRLVQAGFARQDVHIQERPPGEAGTGLPPQAERQLMGSAEREVAAAPGGLASYGRFFASVFGVDAPRGHAQVYSRAVEDGHSVVVVDAGDEEQASRAVELLHDLGAVDVHAAARGQGWDGQGDPGPHRMDRGGVRVFPRASSRPLREALQEDALH